MPYTVMNKKELLSRLGLSEFKVIREDVARILGYDMSNNEDMKRLKRKKKFYPREVELIDKHLGIYNAYE